MKRLTAALALLILFSLGLAACGEAATSTQAPTAAATTAAVTTLAPTGTPFNPIVLTITAGGSRTGSPAAQVAPATPTVPPTFANIAPANFPIYSGLKLINLGYLGQQVADSLSQSSKAARSSFYYTTDSYDKLAGYYNTELPRQGFTKVVEQALPAFTSLTGNVLLYSKGSGATMQVSGMMVLGPLDATLVSMFAAASPEAAGLKDGNSVVIILTDLTTDDLANFQRSFAGANSTPAPVVTLPITPAPTK
jgi:hypothetical protein